MTTPRTYNKSELSFVPKSRWKRVWYHSLPPEQREQYLAYQRNYQRRKRAEKRAKQHTATGDNYAAQDNQSFA